MYITVSIIDLLLYIYILYIYILLYIYTGKERVVHDALNYIYQLYMYLYIYTHIYIIMNYIYLKQFFYYKSKNFSGLLKSTINKNIVLWVFLLWSICLGRISDPIFNSSDSGWVN